MGATHGISSMPVQKLRKRILEVSTSAMPMPRMSLKPTEANVKTKLLTTARWKKPS